MIDRLPEIFSIILPVAVIFSLAYVSKKMRFIDQGAVVGLKALIMNITLPALMFSTLFRAQFDRGSIIIITIMYLCHVIALMLGKLIVRGLKMEKRSL